MDEEQRETVTVAQAMKVLGIKTRKMVIEYINAGYLEARRLSPMPKSPWLIYKDSLDEFMRRREGRR